MALATLSIDIVARMTELQSGMDKAGRLAEKTAAQIEARWARMNQVAARVGAMLGAAVVGVPLTQFFRATVDGLDKLNDLSDATGATVEMLSGLEDVAARTGTSIEVVGDAVIKLNRTLAEAKPDSDAAKALKAIGLSAEDLRQVDPAEALRRVAVALAGYADDGAKARLVGELFGKSIREVAPLLNDLSKSGELNTKVTKEQAEQAERFNQQLAQMEKNSTDAARAIVGQLLPGINRLFEKVRQGGVLSLFRPDEVQTAILDAEAVSQRLRVVTDTILAYQDAANAGDRVAGIKVAAARKEYAELTTRAAALSEQLKKLTGSDQQSLDTERRRREEDRGFKPTLPDLVGGTVAKVDGRTKLFVSNSIEQAEAFRNALKSIEDTDVAKLRELNAQLTALFELQRETRGDPAVVAAIGKVRQTIEELTSKKLPEPEAPRAYIDALQALGSTNIAQVQRLSAALDELFKMRETGLYGPEVDEAIKTTREQLAGLQQPLAQISEFAQQAARNIQDAVGDTLLQTLEGRFDSIGKLWTDLIKRMVAQAAAAQINKALFGDKFGQTGEIGGWIGSAWQWFQTLGGGARADGGPVNAGVPYLVGERGPEIVVPRQAGTVVPNGQIGGGAMTFAPTVHIHGSNTVTAVQVEAALARERVRFARQMRYA